jgi:hypothetical protein
MSKKDNILLLIEFVRDHPELWNKTNPNYKNVILKNDRWADK